MSRGDRKEDIVNGDEDRRMFVKTLGEAAGYAGCEVHTYCVMRNHFHLVVETPKPTLVKGMKWMLGTYTARFNAWHKLRGHLFSGRYKAIVVDDAGEGYYEKRSPCCRRVNSSQITANCSMGERIWTALRRVGTAS